MTRFTAVSSRTHIRAGWLFVQATRTGYGMSPDIHLRQTATYFPVSAFDSYGRYLVR